MKNDLRRTMLYIPGNSPAMLQNADIYGADAVLFDLEDSVSPSEKDAARELVANIIKFRKFKNIEITVRINPIGTSYFEDDVRSVVTSMPDAIRLPKANSREDVKKLETFLEKIEKEHKIKRKINIHPMIETALGVENAHQIATSSKRVNAITIGAQDLTADMGIVKTEEGTEILWARQRIVMAAKAAGIDVMDTIYSDVNNEEGLIKETKLVKMIGFTGKAVIHPKQIKIVHKIFAPTAEEMKWAEEVVEEYKKALKQGKGVIAIRGKMIDPPVFKRAEKVLAMKDIL